ncbi:hypothetical protein CW304_22160 [Bacillus sp. UFRGS-B20]|nr:hypothetical protein CW304_22160 [Bacillus sp. UFRGS-B20]
MFKASSNRPTKSLLEKTLPISCSQALNLMLVAKCVFSGQEIRSNKVLFSFQNRNHKVLCFRRA